jgi:hypothetical protein
LVEAEPIPADGLHGGTKLLILHRFLHAAIGSQLITLGHLAGIVRGGENYDRSHGGPGICPNRPEDLEAVHPGQVEVEQHQARGWESAAVAEGAAPKQEVESLLTVPGHVDAIGRIQLPQRPQRELRLEGAALDEEDVSEGLGSGGAGRVPSGRVGSHLTSSILVVHLLFC